MELKRIYEDDNWVIQETNGNLIISLFKDYHYINEIVITPTMMRGKLMDTLKQLPPEIWEVEE
jgi:hypothetical protein